MMATSYQPIHWMEVSAVKTIKDLRKKVGIPVDLFATVGKHAGFLITLYSLVLDEAKK